MNDLKDEPFVLFGINVVPLETEALKRVMEKENLNWRSIAGGRSIQEDWNAPPTPAYYLLDHEGIIRHKWIGYPGEQTLDASIHRLIALAKTAER